MRGRCFINGGQLCWFPVDAGVGSGRFHGGGERAARCGGGRRLLVVAILLRRSASSVHEEVGDCRHFETELLGDHRLHFFVGSARLVEDGEQRSALDVGEHEARLLRQLMMMMMLG